jgi:AcrR family transcriptional regulator
MPRDADRTRKRILDAAYGQFRRRGYSRVSMDEIASAARLTKRSLYYHFAKSSKDALLSAVLEAQYRSMSLGRLATAPRARWRP